MILNDRDIESYLHTQRLIIKEPCPEIIQPASVDLHLGRGLKTIISTLIDPLSEAPVITESFSMDGGWVLNPGSFILGHTQEWVEIPPTLVGVLTGKSSLARIGLQVEAAGYVDPGWKGRLTVELFNMGPAMIILRPGMPICQLRLHTLASPPRRLYGDTALGSHYQDSAGAVGPRFIVQTPKLLLGQDVSGVGQDEARVGTSVLDEQALADRVDPLL